MDENQLPRLSVSVTLFTVSTDDEIGQARSVRSVISLAPDTPGDFGMGLFCVTRKSNDPDTGQVPASGKRVLPTSLVRPRERVADAVSRVLREEIGLLGHGRIQASRLFDDPDIHDIDGDGRVITLGYWAFVPFDQLAPVLGGRDLVGLEEVSSSAFLDSWAATNSLQDVDGVCRFGLRENPTGRSGHRRKTTVDLWNDRILDLDHDEMVFYAWRRLRYAFGGKLDPFRYLGTRVLAEKFRLSDLRELSDVCRGERVQPDHFRRSLTGEDSFVTDSGDIDRTRPGKPASLYTLKDWADPETTTPR